MKYKYHLYSVGLWGIFSSITCYALPFHITPLGKLPTTVPKGSSVNATYTVTNNTLSTRLNNFVKWFPSNVTQVLEPTDATVCPLFFNLGPHGSINQSCTLKLKISGAVNRDDPNPHNHLFVCFPGGKTCAGPSIVDSLNVSVSNAPPESQLSVLVGAYTNTNALAPLVYTSNNNGATWPKAVLPSIAGLTNQSALIATSCVGPLCTAVGRTRTNNGLSTLTYSSSDGGATWSAPNVLPRTGPLVGSDDSFIIAVSCVKNNCVSGGAFENNTGMTFPLSYTSSDNGITWSAPNVPSIAGLPAGNHGSAIGSISCAGTFCSAVGFYDDVTNDTQPLSYFSNNNGVTWSEAILPSTANYPVGYVSGAKLMSVSCVGTKCSAVGIIHDPINFVKTTPMSYTSANGGQSWSLVKLLSTNGLPPGNQGAFLNSVSCTGTFCTAVGYYTTNTDKQLPVAYFSADNGVTWSLPIIPPVNDIPSGFVNAQLTGVSCKDNICAAAGSYLDIMSNFFPLTYQSLDNGRTWKLFLPSITTIPGATSAVTFSIGGSESGFFRT
ncbi:BNR/Asp-box repeat containing protein [Legionella wadsworthii]|uniref:BNR/Asp-box repeat containing protein n=1 Tax=Legionella wadsworthii TaxID=28088 RepID=A0A378LUY1_9GAMM|nr:sialidase family protein [Legionella wadsworthii]STY31105.1 BNR/Asp-box repeat containing protein [Legionella wadsworthii]